MMQEIQKKYGETYIRSLPARIQQLYWQSLKEMPPFERLWYLIEEQGTLGILRFERGQRKFVPLLRRGSLDDRWVGMSLDKRYVAITAVGLGMAIADVKSHPRKWRTVQFPSDPIYYPRFSPDGRYLLGITNWYDLVLVECATTKATKLINGCVATGWYPDSRTIWCKVLGKRKAVVWYGMDIRTHQRWRLRSDQIRHVQEGWNILNPWWYKAPLDPPRFCVYSRNGQWRLRAEPYDPQIEIPRGRFTKAKLFLDSKRGGVRLLMDGQHVAGVIQPHAVSNNGRWAIISTCDLTRSYRIGDRSYFESHIMVYNTDRLPMCKERQDSPVVPPYEFMEPTEYQSGGAYDVEWRFDE
jgi:hypothetical protein